ncbi:MAG: glycosyltransferase family 4 protein [Candidatus Omnitrophica bacterium]|nr:glycosyltransferase family 4 protein [Candidatus Omnitrophota bacterium]
MNILYLTNHLNIGGISSYVLSLARGMKERGHSVYVASSGGELVERFRAEGVSYLPIPINTKSEANIIKILSSLRRSLSYIKEKDIDILHSNTRVTSVLGSLLEYFSRKPHISTCHGFFKKRLIRRIFPCWGRRVIAISEQVKEHLVIDFGVKPKNIKVVHNGVEPSRFKDYDHNFKSDTKRNLGLGPGPVVGIVARLSEVKGHIYLIQAMKLVLEKIAQAQLLIVGDGKIKKELQALAQSLNIEQNVFFLPSVLDTSKILPIMDLFVLPSLKEGLGLSLMEAMAAGLAVIGSDVGGIKSLIQDGKNGLLFEPANPLALSAAILKILNDPERAMALGYAARRLIRERFSLAEMVLETERLYLECLSANY